MGKIMDRYEIGKAVAEQSEGRITLTIENSIATLRGEFTRKDRQPIRYKNGGWRYRKDDSGEFWTLSVKRIADKLEGETAAKSSRSSSAKSSRKSSRKSSKKTSAKSSGKKYVTPEELEGKTVIFTGRMFRMTRKDVEQKSRRKGMKVSHAFSSCTSFLVKGGFECDEKMVEEAKKRGVRVLGENEFLNALDKIA